MRTRAIMVLATLALTACGSPASTTATAPGASRPATVTVKAFCASGGHPTKLNVEKAGPKGKANTIAVTTAYSQATGLVVFNIDDLTRGYVLYYAGCGADPTTPTITWGRSYVDANLKLFCTRDACAQAG
jgi:hypothetical protein